MRYVLIAAALFAAAPAKAAPAAPPALPDATPAMWVVNDEDTIIYLFGTFHALDGKADWFNDEVRTAFAGSQELVLETIAAPRRARPVSGPLAQARVGAASAPFPALSGSPSFLTSAKQVLAAGRRQGMSAAQGADQVLRRAAEHDGKAIGGLETVEFQLGMMRGMAAAPRPASPAEAAAEPAQMTAVLTFLQAAWKRGDTASFATLLEDMAVRSPANYKIMFRDRNQRWAGWIAQRLERPGTVFVAVGAGHLTGPDSVQHKLADRNIRSARLN